MTPIDAHQRDGSEASTAAMLFAGAITGVALRGTTWVLSAFTIGPVLGFVDFLAAGWSGTRMMLFLQASLTVAAVLAAVLGGLGLQTDPARYRMPVRLLSYLFIADALLYLVPVISVATLPMELSTSAWALFGAALVGNLGLAGLSVLIAYQARRLRPKPQPTAVTEIEISV